LHSDTFSVLPVSYEHPFLYKYPRLIVKKKKLP
jgi:hypothetical protein